jgi:hypothetical protein
MMGSRKTSPLQSWCSQLTTCTQYTKCCLCRISWGWASNAWNMQRPLILNKLNKKVHHIGFTILISMMHGQQNIQFVIPILHTISFHSIILLHAYIQYSGQFIWTTFMHSFHMYTTTFHNPSTDRGDCTGNTVYTSQQINPLTPELNPSVQRCLPRFFTGDFNFYRAHCATSL